MELRTSEPADRFAERILAWYRQHKRDLPWRSSQDPYHIWLSEIMLQQTQISTALPYYQRFLKDYPSLQDLARAKENEVLGIWSGLGYYSRARNLHKTAQIVCEKYDGRFPDSFEQIIELPGIGRYTAGAILSIAFGQPFAVLDGNVRRLMIRYLAFRKPPNGQFDKRLWSLLSKLVEEAAEKSPGDFNQALMEIGALICKPKNPRCGRCPLKESCLARAREMTEQLPLARETRATESHTFCSAVVWNGTGFLMRRNTESPFLKGFWEYPKVEGQPGQETEKEFYTRHGLKLSIIRTAGPVRHQITHRRLSFYPCIIGALGTKPDQAACRWVKPGSSDMPVSSYIEKIRRHVQNQTTVVQLDF